MLVKRLRQEREALEEEILDRLLTLESMRDSRSPLLLQVQRVLPRALDYALDAVESGEVSSPPPDLAYDAQKAARHSLALKTLLTRYLAGYSLFVDLVIVEIGKRRIPSALAFSREVLQSTGAAFEHLVTSLGDAYEEEHASRTRSPTTVTLSRVQDLLSGKLIDAPDLSYEFTGVHVALIGLGNQVPAAMRGVARRLQGQLLLIDGPNGQMWAWIGRRSPFPRSELAAALRIKLPGSNCLGIGEPAARLSGWRRTYLQAQAALAASTRERQIVRYADVAVLSSLIKDPAASRSLRQLYLEPLRQERDGGIVLRATLNAYFTASRNAASAAAALGVSRQTVSHRLRTYEELAECSLLSCASDVEAALLLDEVTGTRIGKI